MTLRLLATAGSALFAMAVSAQLPSPQLPVRDAPARPTIGTAAISGVVTTNDVSPQPLRKVRVTLNEASRALPGRTDTTDDAGRFTFANLPAGRYNLAASRPGFLTTSYGAARPERPGTPIVLADGGQMTGLTMQLARGGVITGSVRDQSGQPLQGALVRVLRYGFSEITGERTLGLQSIGGMTTTDDRGIYRAWGLPPGDYAVVVDINIGRGRIGPGLEDMQRLSAGEIDRVLLSARASGAPRRADDAAVTPTARVVYAPTFHPGTTDAVSSTTVKLGLGEERDGIDVAVQLVPTARIAGTVQFPQGVSAQRVIVTLTAARSSVVIQGSTASPSTDSDGQGRFALAGLPPGNYLLTAKTLGDGGRPGSSGGSRPLWWAQSEVAVDGRDVDLTLDMQPPMKIAGKLVVANSTAPPSNLAGTRVFLVPPGAGGNLSAGPASQFDADGRIEFTGVTPGRYRPVGLPSVIGSAPDNVWALTSSRLNGRDAFDAPIDIQPNENLEWVITYDERPTELSGSVQDASGHAATNYFVLVFPVDRSFWTPGSPRVRSARPGTDGSFSFRGLRPGEYFVAALTDLEPGEWNDASFLAALVPAAVRVSFVAGQRTTQTLRLARTPN